MDFQLSGHQTFDFLLYFFQGSDKRSELGIHNTGKEVDFCEGADAGM